jgi:hypothetical protein
LRRGLARRGRGTIVALGVGVGTDEGDSEKDGG